MKEHRSIEELENVYWQLTDFPSSLFERCFAYRKIPISKLTTEQIRLLISQKIGLPYILPKAFHLLQNDILIEGDFYAGDLLNSLLELNDKDWKQSHVHKKEFTEILQENKSIIEACQNKQLVRKVTAYLSENSEV